MVLFWQKNQTELSLAVINWIRSPPGCYVIKAVNVWPNSQLHHPSIQGPHMNENYHRKAHLIQNDASESK